MREERWEGRKGEGGKEGGRSVGREGAENPPNMQTSEFNIIKTG